MPLDDLVEYAKPAEPGPSLSLSRSEHPIEYGFYFEEVAFGADGSTFVDDEAEFWFTRLDSPTVHGAAQGAASRRFSSVAASSFGGMR
jgi:hypothetical protein